MLQRQSVRLRGSASVVIVNINRLLRLGTKTSLYIVMNWVIRCVVMTHLVKLTDPAKCSP